MFRSSSYFLHTVLLVSAVVENIDCLPTPSQLGRLSKSTFKRPALKGERFRSTPAPYRGPIVPHTDKEAVAIVDAKNDDHMAVAHLRNIGHYSNVHLVLSGLRDQEAAHGSVKDFHDQITKTRWEKGLGPFPQSKLKVYKGGESPLEEAAPHEVHFTGTPRPIHHSLDDLHRHFHPETKHVDVFHLAPIKDDDLDKVFDRIHKGRKKVGVFHSTIGYNSLQSPEHKSNGEAEKQHLENLHKKPRNKDARTVLLQTKTSFGDSRGGTQSLEWTAARSTPNAMNAVTEKEPFHLGQLKHADRMVSEHNERFEDDPTKQVMPPKPIPGKDDKEQQANVWAGRAKKDDYGKVMSQKMFDHADQRQKALEQIQHHDPTADHSNTLRRLDAVKDGMKNPCAVETCDANHVAVVIDAHYNHPEKFVPVTVKTGRNVAPAREGDPVHGLTLLNETQDHARELLEPTLLPIFEGKGNGKAS